MPLSLPDRNQRSPRYFAMSMVFARFSPRLETAEHTPMLLRKSAALMAVTPLLSLKAAWELTTNAARTMRSTAWQICGQSCRKARGECRMRDGSEPLLHPAENFDHCCIGWGWIFIKTPHKGLSS